MKIWIISDTHTYHDLLKVPDCDLVIFCGDCSNSKSIAVNSNEVQDFISWWNTIGLPKVFVPGNHDTSIEAGLCKPTNTLIHKTTNMNGLYIFGSPFTPKFGRWSFTLERDRIHNVWSSIPNQVDILITHGPPYGILDKARCVNTNKVVSVGCKSLLKKVKQVKPKIHCFGHIHDNPIDKVKNHGTIRLNDTLFCNASCIFYDASHVGFHQGHVVEL